MKWQLIKDDIIIKSEIKIEENDGFSPDGGEHYSFSYYSKADLCILLKELYLCMYDKKLDEDMLSEMVNDYEDFFDGVFKLMNII